MKLALVLFLALASAAGYSQPVSQADRTAMMELRRDLDRPVNQSRIDQQSKQKAAEIGANLPFVKNVRNLLKDAQARGNKNAAAALSEVLKDIFDDCLWRGRLIVESEEVRIDDNIYARMDQIISRYSIGTRGEIGNLKRKIRALEKRAAQQPADAEDYSVDAAINADEWAEKDPKVIAMLDRIGTSADVGEISKTWAELMQMMHERRDLEATKLLEADIAQAKADLPVAQDQLNILETRRIQEEEVAAVEDLARAAQEQADILRAIAFDVGIVVP